MLSFKKIKETCLYVTDLDRTQAFYHDLLQLPIIGRIEGRHIFFRAGNSVLLCFLSEATSQDQHLPPHYGSGQLHLAFEVSKEEYAAVKQQVEQAGISIEHEEPWPFGLKSFYFRDPDGHLLEVVPEGMWESPKD